MKNKNFSLRSFAQFLGLSPGYLSLLLRSEKLISLQKAEEVAKRLDLSNEKKTYFLSLVRSDQTSNELFALQKLSGQHELNKAIDNLKVNPFEDYPAIEEERFNLLLNWQTLTVLEIFSLKNYEFDLDEVSNYLKISKLNLIEIIQRLKSAGMLVTDDGGHLRKKDLLLTFPTKKTRPVIRNFHKQLMTKAIEALDTQTSEDEYNARSIKGTTLSLNAKQIEIIKTKINHFIGEVSESTNSDDESDQVYYLALQFFPIFKSKKAKRKKEAAS